VDLDFYVHVGISWKCESPQMRCHNHLSFS
jgi:hypothetical protein